MDEPEPRDPEEPPAEPFTPPRPFRPLERRARIVVWLLAANAVLAVVGIASDLLERSLLEDIAAGRLLTDAETRSSDTRQAAVGVLQGVVFVVTAVFFIAWLHRAYRNLPSLGASDRRFGEGWVVGAWFVPFLSLWRPKQIVNDVWRASDPAAPPAQGGGWRKAPVPLLLLVWWLAWVAEETLWNVAFRWQRAADTLPELRAGNGLVIAADVGTLLVSLLALLVVRRLTRRQTARAAALELVPEEDPVPVVRRRSTWAAAGATTLAVGLQAAFFWAAWAGALDLAAPAAGDTEPPASGAPPGVLVADDFTTRAGGWAARRNDEVDMGYVGQKYHIRVKEPGEWLSIAAFTKEADAVRIEVAAEVAEGKPSDWFGVGCWPTDDLAYQAALFPDGFWILVKAPQRGGSYKTLAEGRDQASIRPSGPNRLRLECDRSDGAVTLELWVSDSKVGKARDPESVPPFRALGLLAGSETSVDVVFDDVVARELER